MKDIKLDSNTNNELKKFIEEVIEDAYASFNEKSTAEVKITDSGEIQLWYDSEKPYLDANFFVLLDTVSERIKERMNQEGYEKKRREAFYDFIVICYSRD